MQITFLFGSPRRDEHSYTRPFIEYIIKNFKEIDFKIVKITYNQLNDEYFESTLNTIKESDGIIWIYPVYKGFVPFQMKFYIEKSIANNVLDEMYLYSYHYFIETEVLK